MEALVSQTALSPNLSQLAGRQLNHSRATRLALGLHLNAGKTGAGCFPGVAIRRNDIAGEKTKNQ
jgi:hypothetical protein